MIARVLIINEHKFDISKISMKLQSVNSPVLFSKSTEDSIRVIGTQSIDLVLISLPQKQSKLFFDFFSMLRQICKVIPIIGLTDKNIQTDTSQFLDLGLDDIIDINISRVEFLKKINVMIRIKDKFDETLLSNMFLEEKRSQKIVTIFHEDVDFLHKSIVDNSEIISLKTWPVVDNINDADLFLINGEKSESGECCVNIRLRSYNKHKPILITYKGSASRKASVKHILNSANFGYTDVLNTASDKVAIACRVNSFIRYKKLYEEFSKKIKKNIYLSAIDSTTEVYNRSFFEDYIKSRGTKLYNSAIVMIDVDKFKIVNDKFGHSFADSMLKYISNTIKNYVRSSDVIARYGGDEFIILMNNVSSTVATGIANRIKRTIENSRFNDIACTVSIGVCCIDNNKHIDIQEAISIADKFMYIAKQDGGNSVKICA